MPLRKNPYTEPSTNLAGQLEEAFNIIGTSMMKKDYAAKLLAYLYKYGGGNEAVVYHQRMNADIMIAQEKFNIKGGQVPDMEGVILLQKYIKELNAEKEDLSTPWLWEIYLRYDLNTSSMKCECPEDVRDVYAFTKPAPKNSKKAKVVEEPEEVLPTSPPPAKKSKRDLLDSLADDMGF